MATQPSRSTPAVAHNPGELNTSAHAGTVPAASSRHNQPEQPRRKGATGPVDPICIEGLTSSSGRPIDRDSGKTLRLPLIHDKLVETYGDGVIELNWNTPLELLIATVLSAQSTDVMVNKITAKLFKKYHEPEDYLSVPQTELEQDIKSSGFYRQKAKSIRGLCAGILERFDGEVPSTVAELITLPGVARKTANVVQSGAFPEVMAVDPDAGIAVDTHVIRLSRRLGYTRNTDAVKIEAELKRMYPRTQWSNASLVTILHGRRCCDALKPACHRCPVEPLCPSSLTAGRRDKAGQARSLGD